MLNKLRSNALLSGTFLMFVGTNIANFFGFIYQFAMGRLLAEKEFGELVAFLSLLGLLSSLYSFAGLLIIKYVAASDEEGKKQIFQWFTKKATKIGLVSSAIILLLTPAFAYFLHMPPALLLLVAPVYLVWLLSYVYKAVLQGVLRFFETVVVANVDLLIRLVIGVVLVFLGMHAFGAIIGVFIGSLCSFWLAKIYMRHFESKGTFTPDKQFYQFGIGALVYTIATTSFFTSDVLLVKHYFDPISAGLFGAVAVLGKTIMYATIPIAAVMFPLVAKKHSEGAEYRKVFLTSMGINAMVAVAMCAIFGLFPSLLLSILFGQFQEASYLMLPYAIFISFYTLSTLFANYYLSQGKTKMTFIFLAFSIIQVLGIVLFHQTTLQVLHVSAGVTIALFATLLIYFLYEKHTKK